MSNCNPIHTPLPLRLDHVFRDKQLFSEPSYFRSLAGKLQYLTITRPDIQFAVNFICQRMHSPTESDFGLLKRILRYLRGTTDMGLNFSKNSDLGLVSYSDSDYAGCQDTRRSTSGFCALLGSNLVSWSAKRQPTVSRSSTEAEYRALATTACELTWISAVLRDLGISQPEPALLQCDNLSAVHLSANPVFHSRSKHFEVDCHYVRERVALGVLEIQHIPAALQLADIFTKSLPRRSFQQLRAKLSVGLSPIISLRGAVSNNSIMGHRTDQGPTIMKKATQPITQRSLSSFSATSDKVRAPPSSATSDKAGLVQMSKTVKPASEGYQILLSNQFDSLLSSDNS